MLQVLQSSPGLDMSKAPVLVCTQLGADGVTVKWAAPKHDNASSLQYRCFQDQQCIFNY